MNYLLLVLAALALALTQVLAGGRQLALSLPGYGLLALAAFLSWWPARRTSIPRTAAECLIAGMIFIACIVIRAIFSPEEYLARKDLYMALGAGIVYLLFALNLTSTKLRLLCVAGLLLLGAANCAVGAIQFLKGQNFMVLDFLVRGEYGSRASGFFGYPNHLAAFLNVTLLMGLAVTLWSRWPIWVKVFTAYLSLVCLLGIMLTGSRGGYVSCAAGLLIFSLLGLYLIRKSGSARVVLIVVGVLAVGVIGWGAQRLVSRNFLLHSRASETLTVDRTRLMLWRAAWQQFRLHPVTGTGSGTYLYYGRQFRSPHIQRDPVYAHNEYIQLLAEYGILGIMALVILLETHLRSGWKFLAGSRSSASNALLAPSNSTALTVGAISAIAACMVHSFLDFTLHSPANAFVLAFAFALLANPGGVPDTDSADEPGLPSWLRLALPTLGIWLGIRALPTLPAEYYGEKARAVIADWRLLTTPEVAQNALALARRGIDRDARNPELHFYVGVAQSALALQATDRAAKTDLYTQSLDAYQKAMNLAPRDVRLLLSVGESLDALGRFDESTPLFDRARTLDPKSGTVLTACATHLRLQGRLNEAATLYRQAQQLGAGPAADIGLERVTEGLKSSNGSVQPEPLRP